MDSQKYEYCADYLDNDDCKIWEEGNCCCGKQAGHEGPHECGCGQVWDKQ